MFKFNIFKSRDRFCHDLRGHVKEQHPEYTLGEIAKELGRRWGVSDDATKAQYAAKAEQDRARYERVSYHHFVIISCLSTVSYFHWFPSGHECV